MQEKFFKAQFLLNNLNGGFSMFLRVVTFTQAKPPLHEMDYYDYCTYYNPEKEGFYEKNQNLYKYHPYESFCPSPKQIK